MVPAVGLFRGPGACPDLGAFFRGIFLGHIGGHVEQNSVCRDTNAVDERNQPHLVFWLYFIIFLQYFPLFFRISLPSRGAPARWGTAYPSGGRGFSGASGRSAPLPARPRAGARLSLEESRRKEHQGGRGSSSLDPPFSGWGGPCGVLSFLPGLRPPVSYARNGPPTGWAGWGRWFRRREGSFPTPKPSPWGRWAGEAGSDEGRFGTQPFLVEVERGLPPVAPTEFFFCSVGHVGRPLISHLR